MLPTAILDFLSDLSANNNRDWFEKHKKDYLQQKTEFEKFIEKFITELAAVEPTFGLLEAKKCIFRIYRDVRFSKDKTPYKTHFAAGLSKGGRRVHLPGYYLHIMPNGQSFFGGGIWHPDKEMLHKIRQEIDYNFEEFTGILATIRQSGLLDRIADGESLQRPPKGYEADNPAIEYLKMKNFILSRSFPDKQVTGKKIMPDLLQTYQIMRPFNAFIERALD